MRRGLFRSVGAMRCLWDVVYPADDYIAVLDTYSHHRTRGDSTRSRLLDRIDTRIEARPQRSVRKTYLAMLYVAEREPAALIHLRAGRAIPGRREPERGRVSDQRKPAPVRRALEVEHVELDVPIKRGILAGTS